MQSLRSPGWLLLAALLLGFCADWLFIGRWAGISVPLFVALGLVALAWLGARERKPAVRANLWIGGAALFFASMLALRDSPVLVFFNGAAVLGLLLLLVAYYRGAALFSTPLLGALANLVVASFSIVFLPFSLLGQSIGALPVRQMRLGAMAPLARGMLLAAPVMLCFGGLLMAADSVFASYVTQMFSLQFPFDVEDVVGHGIFMLMVGWLCAGGLAAALVADPPAVSAPLPAEGDTQRLAVERPAWRVLGWVEALTVLVSLDLLFSMFMLVQGAYFFGGSDTLARTQMTYADYARRGFFELVVVACMSLALLYLLALIARREPGSQRRAFNAASVAMVALVLGMLASAFQRMLLYESAYGFTELRLYTHSFMVWLGVVLVLFVAALLRDQLQLFVFGSVASALVCLAALNLANPDALIVRANVARYVTSDSIDAWYLSSLSADAVPDLVAALPKLDPETRRYLESSLADHREVLAEAAVQQGWPAWSLARAQALVALGAIESLP